MTAVAHPTPVVTLKAPVGQLRWQAPHSRQASRFSISTEPFAAESTSLGQTERHMWQPIHFVLSSCRVTTFLRYTRAIGYLPVTRAANQRTSPTVVPVIWSGKAHRISLRTPDKEVYVEQPVKFMAK